MARTVVLGVCAVLALSACNAILGMEHARLDEEGVTSGTGGAGGSAGDPFPGKPRLAAAQQRACTQGSTACTDCLKGCSGYDTCISNKDCRASLDDYAYCLGKTCSGDAEECSFGVEPPSFKSCLLDCKDCVKSTLASTCELYCGCMGEFCDGYLKGDCMQQCQSWALQIAACRRDHCEYAKNGIVGDVDHCLHASGAQDVCASVGPLKEPSAMCLGLQLSGWACDSSKECCSKTCLDGKCK